MAAAGRLVTLDYGYVAEIQTQRAMLLWPGRLDRDSEDEESASTRAARRNHL